MKINKAYKFRMYPNEIQKEMINKTIGCTRLVYNYYLNMKITKYKKEKENISCYDTIKNLKELYLEKPFLKEVDSMSLRCALFDLEDSYNKFFKEKKGFPKFKNRNEKNTYRTNYIKNKYKGKIYENIKIDLIKKEITLPKLKNVKIRGYRNIKEIKGRIINATIIREKDNTYYVSVLVEEEIKENKFMPNNIIGIDLGIKDLVVTSNSEKYSNEKTLQKYEKRIKMHQRRLSRKQKGSKNYYKEKQKLARMYKKIKNTRKYYIHKITNKIIKTNDIIVTETLKIKNMVKNHKLSKSLLDSKLYEIIKQLEYKSKWNNKKMYKIDTIYPSSQICSKCGYKNKKMKDLKIRKLKCESCNNEIDRDINAAENIMFEGLKMYMKELKI